MAQKNMGGPLLPLFKRVGYEKRVSTLSCLLFALMMKPLATALWQSEWVIGI